MTATETPNPIPDKPASWLICDGDTGGAWPGAACSTPQAFEKEGPSPTEDATAPGASCWERGIRAAEPSRMFGGARDNFFQKICII